MIGQNRATFLHAGWPLPGKPFFQESKGYQLNGEKEAILNAGPPAGLIDFLRKMILPFTDPYRPALRRTFSGGLMEIRTLSIDFQPVEKGDALMSVFSFPAAENRFSDRTGCLEIIQYHEDQLRQKLDAFRSPETAHVCRQLFPPHFIIQSDHEMCSKRDNCPYGIYMFTGGGFPEIGRGENLSITGMDRKGFPQRSMTGILVYRPGGLFLLGQKLLFFLKNIT